MSGEDEINKEMTQQLLLLSTDDILELINTTGIVAVIMDADKIQRTKMGTALLAYAHKAMAEAGFRIMTDLFDAETGLSARYVNGERVD